MNTNPKTLRVLIVEDSENDAKLLAREIMRGGYEVTWERVDTAETIRAALARQPWDLILSDYRLPRFSGLEALRVVQASGLDIPFILVSGTLEEEQAVESLKAGAHDFVTKIRLARLLPAVERELVSATQRRQKREAEQALLRNEKYFRALTENSLDILTVLEADGTVRYESPSIERVLGWRSDEFIGRNGLDGIHPEDRDRVQRLWDEFRVKPGSLMSVECRCRRRDGSWRFLESISRNLLDDPDIAGIVVNSRDVTERKQAEEAVREQFQLAEAFFNQTLNSVAILDRHYNFLRVNEAYARDCRRDISAFAGRNHFELYPSEAKAIFDDVVRTKQPCVTRGRPFIYPDQPDRGVTYWDWTLVPILDAKDEVEYLVFSLNEVTERKRAEMALRENEEKHRILFESSRDPIIMLDPKGRVSLWNPAAEEVLGYSREEALGQELHQWLAPPRYEAAYRAAMPNFQATGRGAAIGKTVELAARRRDGVEIPIELTLSAIKLKAQWHALGILRDITERKRDEERLRLQGSALKAAVNGIVITDKGGRIAWVNPAFERLTGYSAAEAIGQNPRLLKSGQHEAAFYQQMWETILAGAAWQGEIVNRKKDGTLYTESMTITPVRDDAGQITHFIAIKRDVTADKQAAAERERLLNDRLLLLDSIDEGIYGVGLEKRCTFINPAGARMLGYKPEEVVGQIMHDLIHHHRADGSVYPVAECPMYKAMRDGKPCRVDNEVFWRRDGSAFPVEYSSHSIMENGQFKGAVITFTDITAKRQLERQFLRAQRMEGIGTLASGIAHDLNNILTPILMGIQLLRLKPRDEDDQNLFTTMETSARRGSDIVQQVLTFARGVEGARVQVQLRHLIRDMTKIARETFPKSIEVKVNADADCWPVLGDPTQLHQVLLNLCINARDAMPDGGVLKLRAENVVIDESYASGVPDAKPGPHVVLKVEDTGTGIPSALLDQIFDPFFTTKELGKGTGLGLSTVMGIVRSHGGFVHVESEPYRGAAFHIYLPATPGGAEIMAGTAPAALPRGNGETILVVDDEAGIRDVTGEILKHHGYKVLVAADGTEALALIAEMKDKIDLVLTDALMPFMDGPNLVRALRMIKPDMRVVACSGAGQESKEREFAALGAKAFLAKPFTTEQLLATLRDVLAAPA